MRNYKELNVWKSGIDIVNRIYDLTDQFPENERYGLIVQMPRSSISIPSNIAEGFMRFYTKEYIRFLYISLGSCEN